MAGDWIKVQKDTPDKPEVLAIASRMGLDPDAVVGKLIRIWSWFDTHTIDGNALSVTFSFLDRLTGVTGFAEQVALVGWLEHNGQNLSLPNFSNHNGETAKKRSLGKNRTQKYRSNAESNAESVTKTSPEKRREEKIYTVSKDTGVASDREKIFAFGIPLLTSAGIKESQARSFFGKLIKDNGDAAVADALRECFRMKPIQPLEWLVAALNGSSRPQMNKQEALEASNMEIARRASERFLNEQA